MLYCASEILLQFQTKQFTTLKHSIKILAHLPEFELRPLRDINDVRAGNLRVSDEFDWVTTTESFGIPFIIAPLNRDSLYFVLLICRNKNWVSHLRGKTDRNF